MMDKSVKTAANLAELWLSGDYMERKLLQDILFPEGVVYDKKNDLLRASRVNEVMSLIRDISDFLDNKKGDNSAENFAMSPVVDRTGLEPVISIADFWSIGLIGLWHLGL
jgi:site-specific DNA recombinase